jgi:phenylpyruvate tautomerase PptA (4-oxalocrotonate tautomerase family)
MPLVRVDVRRGRSSEALHLVRRCIHQAMCETFDVPPDDRFMVVTQHDADEFDCDPTYAGMARTDELIIVQIFCNTTRGLREKHALFKRMNELLVARCMIRPDDLFVNLVETPRLNWSFGRGEP